MQNSLPEDSAGLLEKGLYNTTESTLIKFYIVLPQRRFPQAST